LLESLIFTKGMEERTLQPAMHNKRWMRTYIL
jgi:hypothetical protein